VDHYAESPPPSHLPLHPSSSSSDKDDDGGGDEAFMKLFRWFI
jgi:hypothetical protein